MSVDYRAIVACGWIVSDAEVHQLDDYIHEELLDCEILICQNAYAEISSYIYVYGDYAFSCGEDTIYTPGLAAPAIDEHPDEIMKFYELFPNHVGELPEVHVMIQAY